MSNFLGKELTEEELLKLESHLSFSNFEKTDAVNCVPIKRSGLMHLDAGNFFRKGITISILLLKNFNFKTNRNLGIIGDWKNHFSPELSEKVDQWITKNLFGTDLKFISE